MRDVLALFIPVLGALAFSLALGAFLRSRRLARRPFPLNIAAARRESHALGLPFPESDGTLSLPPEPKSAIAKTQVHVMAQFGVTSEEALDAVYEALYGSDPLR